jgi:hypothetical protein
MPNEWDDHLRALGLSTPDENQSGIDWQLTGPETFANPAVVGLLAGAGRAAMVPGQIMQPNPYPAGSEEWEAYNRFSQAGQSDWANRQAIGMLGGGGAGAPGVSSALTAGANWQRALESVKSKPSLLEMGQEPLVTDIWSVDPSALAPGQFVKAGEGGPIGVFQGVSPSGTVKVDWKGAGGAGESLASAYSKLQGDQSAAAMAKIEEVLGGGKGAPAGLPRPGASLPSNEGYTLSSAFNKNFPGTEKDYFVHDPSGKIVGDLTHNERIVTGRDPAGAPASWLPASWTLDMPGVAAKSGSSLEELMQLVPGWHKGAQSFYRQVAEENGMPWKAGDTAKVTDLSEKAINEALSKNPGASIGDLAGPAGWGSTAWPSSKVKPPVDKTGGAYQLFKDLGEFPKSVPYVPGEVAVRQGYLTPALHGTRLGEQRWVVPGGEATAAELGGLGSAHEAGLDALRLPENELGVHFGTPEQAHFFTSKELGAGYLPRTYPTVLQTGRSLELPDMGTWEHSRIQDALDKLHEGEGFGVSHGKFKVAEPEAHIGEFPRSERGHISSIEDMRAYLASKGYDSVNYINKVEGPGQRSYIMFKPSPVDPRFVKGVRSRFAQFDPSKVASPLLAAGLAGAAASPVLFGPQNEPYVQLR